MRVLVDGQAAGVIAWPPNEVDITDHVKGASAELRIEVVAHRRNSHGPLHLADAHPEWVGSGQFATRGKLWSEGYRLVACGLTARPMLVTRK